MWIENGKDHVIYNSDNIVVIKVTYWPHGPNICMTDVNGDDHLIDFSNDVCKGKQHAISEYNKICKGINRGDSLVYIDNRPLDDINREYEARESARKEAEKRAAEESLKRYAEALAGGTGHDA